MNTTAAPMMQADEVARVGDVEDAAVLRDVGGRRRWPPWTLIASIVAQCARCRPGTTPNSAVAASTAVAIAMPLVIALVVLPTASSRGEDASALARCTSPDISAMPWALSETGPKVSIDTMTPTVVSRPVPASATANSDST